jgi:hypothetical protein
MADSPVPTRVRLARLPAHVWAVAVVVILSLILTVGAPGVRSAEKTSGQGMKTSGRIVAAGTVVAADAPDPLRFAAALAKDGVPAGFVVALPDPSEDLSSIEADDPGSPGSLNDAVQRFISTHRGYTIRDSDRALIIRPRGPTVCDSALQRSLAGEVITAPAYEIFWRLALITNPNRVPSAPPSVVCGGNCDSASTAHHQVNVTIPLVGVSLEEALSQVVQQAPGLVWVLRETWSEPHREWACGLAYFDGEHHVATSYILASGPARQ